MKNRYRLLFLLFFIFGNSSLIFAQFPNPITFSTGQGTPGTNDPIWTCSQWFPTQPTDTTGAIFGPCLINNNCAPGNWVDPQSLPAPVNNGNWITGTDAPCDNNVSYGYRFFRLVLNLPADCNGFSVTTPGNYTLSFNGYVDNVITNVFVNNVPTGFSGGSFGPGQSLNFTLTGPWLVGTNYIDILIQNTYNSGNDNPYGLLLVADANSLNGNDTDNDGIEDPFDQCICEPGNNPVGCNEPQFTCDIDTIRAIFNNAGCTELEGCWDDCHMYFLNPQFMSGDDAQAFAQQYGANLISIHSAAENQCILDELNRVGETGVIWIGFNDELAEGNFVWYDESTVDYTNWATGEPNNSGGNEDCVQIYPGGSQPGTWNDLNCGGYDSKSIIEVNLCPVTNVNPPITMCHEQDTVIKVTSTILGSFPYTYQWSNGSTSTSQNVNPMTNTDYYVTTKDRYNCSVVDTVKITVNLKPTADFTANENCDSVPTIAFTNSSTISDNSTLNASWNFGDGQSANSTNSTHQFPNFGSQNVTLITTSLAGCSDTITKTYNVFAQPVADFTFNNDCNVNPEIVFQNNSTVPDNSTLSNSWDFGNGQTSTAQNPTYTFPTPNNNSVTLIVTTSNNCKDSITKIVNANILPQVDFSFTSNCEGQAITFQNNTTINGQAVATSNWNFGNGQTSTDQNPTTTFSPAGTYSVTLVSTGSNGCKDSLTKQVEVYPYPEMPTIQSNAPVECPQDMFVFSTSNVSGASYFWSGPENYSSNHPSDSLVATENNTGDYHLYIEINGCASDTATTTLTIKGQIAPLTTDFPNVFTPNGDHINDQVDLNDFFTPCTKFKIEYFNRWGEKVWEQTPDSAPFAGKDQKSGNALANGVYFYKLTYGKEMKQGTITIAH